MKPLALAIGAAFVTSLASATVANAAENPFAMSELSSGYMVAEMAEGKCGEGKMKEGADKMKEGKCGEGKMKDAAGKMEEGKCGEGKCGAKRKAHEGKCGEGKCGADKMKEGMKMEGEGKCGAEKMKKEGEGKCGGSKK